jgi:uncharacterized protein YjiS (DUF1127 family)
MMTSLTDHRFAPARPVFGAELIDRLTRLLRAGPALARQRRALARLDDHLLRDIGIDPREAWSEAVRPVWDVPRHWHD